MFIIQGSKKSDFRRPICCLLISFILVHQSAPRNARAETLPQHSSPVANNPEDREGETRPQTRPTPVASTTTTITTISITSTTNTTLPTEPLACNLWNFSLKYEGDWALGTGYRPPAIASGVSDWLKNSIESLIPFCSNLQNLWGSYARNRDFYDDCIASYFTGEPFAYNYSRGLSFRLPNTLSLQPLNGQWQHRQEMNRMLRTGGTFIFDAQHNNLLNLPADAQLCDAGSFNWRASPISLIWEHDYEIDQDIRIVSFPIDPTKSGKWFIWKASGKAPLLVYDPNHQGKITSGTQLFGNWTLGGRRLAALYTGNTSKIKFEKWSNGFEALSSFDDNNDQVLRNEELEPLALWFDHNQNAIAEPGEVKSLREVSVSALFYRPDRIEQATNNIIARVGFERTIGEKRILGSSVDWHSDYADSIQELIHKHLAHSIMCEKISTGKENKQVGPALLSDIIDTPSRQNKKILPVASSIKLSGIWRWYSNDTKFEQLDYAPQGYLGFNDHGDSSLSGHSYSEMYFNNQSKHAKTLLNIQYLTGQKTINNEQETSISFIIKTADGSVIRSHAKLSADGNRLIGRSTATVLHRGKPISITYPWRAIRQG